jgi:hypothetical protein
VAPATDNYRRDQLWIAAYDTYYYVYFDELVFDTLATRWSRIDEYAKGILAITSAATSWALWQQPAWREVWAVVAGVGALIAILHLTLGVTYRLRGLNDCKIRLIRLRHDFQTFRMRMRLKPEFPVDQFESELLELRKRYMDDCPKTTDLFETKKMRQKLQDFLNTQIT